MNFFFGIKSSILATTLTIPRFQNTNPTNNHYGVFKLSISEKRWKIDHCDDAISSADFFQIEDNLINNGNFFCLATKDEVRNFEENHSKKLINLNNYTDTVPAFRANMRVSINEGGFSSYQSEYPFFMVTKRASILSPLSSLCTKDADQNILFLKNIYELPIHNEFGAYFVNIKTKKVLKKEIVVTNLLNEIIVEKELISPEIFLFTDKYLGVPIFCSIKNKHISLEHTHPPHEYIKGANQFELASALKKEFNDIIN